MSDWSISQILQRNQQSQALGMPQMTGQQVGEAVSGALEANYQTAVQESEAYQQFTEAQEAMSQEKQFRTIQAQQAQMGIKQNQEKITQQQFSGIGQLAITGAANAGKIYDTATKGYNAISGMVSSSGVPTATDTATLASGPLTGMTASEAAGGYSPVVGGALNFAEATGGVELGGEAGMLGAQAGAEELAYDAAEGGVEAAAIEGGAPFAPETLGLSMIPAAAIALFNFVPGLSDALGGLAKSVGSFASDVWKGISSLI
jgi:hypothetical protein